MSMLKTILSGYSLNRVKDVLDGDNFSIRDIPVFILWGFVFLLLVVIGIGSVIYALAIPIIALASYDAGKLLLYVPDLLVMAICAASLFGFFKVIADG